jgi:SM-20-related protein
MVPHMSTNTSLGTVESTRHGICVIDDYLPRALYDPLADLIAKVPLIYGARSNTRTDPHGHWSHSFVDADRLNLADVAHDLTRSEQLAPLDHAWGFIRQTAGANEALIRCYLNAYTYGTDGYFHVDSLRPDELTTVLCMNDYWEPDWAGETVFLDERGEILKSILPGPNRAIIFPAQIQHACRGVSRKCTSLRKTLVFKTRKRRTANFEKLSSFLRQAGAAKLRHRSGTLHDHLVRTFGLLEAKAFDECVCFAGGLHSIFGTNAYEPALLSQADWQRVADEFGAHAQELARCFASLERPETLENPRQLTDRGAVVELRGGQTMTLDRNSFDALRYIECANLADQNELNRYEALSAIWNRS